MTVNRPHARVPRWRRSREWLRFAELETRWLTIAFWSAVACFVTAYWVTPFPPSIDYPQHLLLGALIRRLMDPAAPEHQVYVVTPFTYNGLFHMLVAALSLVLPTEVAGKLVLSAIPVLTGSAGLVLMRVARRPLWYAFMLLPFCFSYIVGWGFVNYAVAAPLALMVIAWWIRWRSGERHLWPWVVAVALVIAYAHVLVTLCLCISVGVASLASALPREVGTRRAVQNALLAPLPLLPAAAYSFAVFLVHRSAPHIYWEPVRDGTDVPAFTKIWHLATFAISNLSNQFDVTLFLLCLVLLLSLWIAAGFVRGQGEGLTETPAIAEAHEDHRSGFRLLTPRVQRELSALAVVWFFLYLITPRVFMSTWWIFERIPLWWLAFTVAVTPVASNAVALVVKPLAVVAATLAGLNTLLGFARIPDAADADGILDDIPEGSRVVAVMHSTSGEPGVWRELWVHHLAYYVVRKRGEVAFDFTRYASLPVRRRDAGTRPPLFPSGHEWVPDRYDPRAEYARHYRLVLVRTPTASPEEDPRYLTFGTDSDLVDMISHRGRFWLYDTRRIHESAVSPGTPW